MLPPSTQECDLLRTARERALGVLRACVSPAGFRASAQQPGYPQVWARDSIITGLGALASADPDLVATFRRSLETIAAHRTELGHIPLNVDPESGAVSGEMPLVWTPTCGSCSATPHTCASAVTWSFYARTGAPFSPPCCGCATRT